MSYNRDISTITADGFSADQSKFLSNPFLVPKILQAG